MTRLTGFRIVDISKRLVTRGAPYGFWPGLLALALLLSACAGPGDEPTVGAGETVTALPTPTATDEPVTASATAAATETPAKVATEVAAEPTTASDPTATGEGARPPERTALQIKLDLPAGTAISLHQTGGFAGVDDLYIFYDDGRILLPSGERATIPAEEVAAQVSALDAMGYFDMDRPEKKPICCDNFNYTLYARHGEREQVMTVNWGDPDLSPELMAFILALQEMAVEAGES